MRLLVRVFVAVLMLGATPVAAHAQAQPPPFEDVVLRGRILSSDGSPAAHKTVQVDAISDVGFGFFAFFATFGLSTFSCLAGPGELCPIPNGKRFRGATDANGQYSFTFRNAHRRGEQTNTDYVLSIGVPSAQDPDRSVVASYELELQDAVHNAPDLRIWDPSVALSRGSRGYTVAYPRRPNSSNGRQVLSGDKAIGGDVERDGTIDARAVEDLTFTVTPTASKNEAVAGTIYHQRFTAVPVTRKGTLVPLSRGVACSAMRKDGTTVGACGYTDGDLATDGANDPNPCRYDFDGNPYITENIQTGKRVPCQAPVTQVALDLGAAQQVGEIRARCGCEIWVSADGTTWRTVPPSGLLVRAQAVRYVRLTGPSIGGAPEVSVWPPWPEQTISPITESTRPRVTVAPDVPDAQASGNDAAPSHHNGRPWLAFAVAVIALAAGALVLRSLARAMREV